MNRYLPILTLTIAAALTTGCGSIANPYTKTEAAPAASSTAAPAATAAPTSQAPRAATADQAIRQFTTAFINWRFDALPKQRLALAAQASGTLAADMKKDAAQALDEVSRRASNQANTGTVDVVDDPKHNGQFFVVTHETAQLGDSHAQAGYFVYRANAQKTASGYKLTSFKAVS
jgi:hypothetical protein